MLKTIALVSALALSTSLSFAAQDVVHAVEGTVTKVDAALNRPFLKSPGFGRRFASVGLLSIIDANMPFGNISMKNRCLRKNSTTPAPVLNIAQKQMIFNRNMTSFLSLAI